MTTKEKIVANWDDVDLLDQDEHIEQASRAMKAMSHPLRLKILCVLGDKEVAARTVSARTRAGENLAPVALEAFISRLKSEVAGRI